MYCRSDKACLLMFKNFLQYFFPMLFLCTLQMFRGVSFNYGYFGHVKTLTKHISLTSLFNFPSNNVQWFIH